VPTSKTKHNIQQYGILQPRVLFIPLCSECTLLPTPFSCGIGLLSRIGWVGPAPDLLTNHQAPGKESLIIAGCANYLGLLAPGALRAGWRRPRTSIVFNSWLDVCLLVAINVVRNAITVNARSVPRHSLADSPLPCGRWAHLVNFTTREIRLPAPILTYIE